MLAQRHAIRLLSVALVAMSPASALAAAAPGGNSIGAGLLDDDLAKALSLPEPSAPATGEGDGWLPDDELMGRLLNPGAPAASAGEDVGAGPLDGVVSGMKAASGLISDNRVATQAAPVQRRVVSELEQLIAQMEKQCQGGQCQGQKKPSEGRQQSRRSEPKEGGQCDKPGDCEGDGKPKASQSASANLSGTTSLGNAGEAGDVTDPEELMKAAWGHLPERVRERMLKGAGGEFLPAYRDELRRYYRRLAEREADPDATGAP